MSVVVTILKVLPIWLKSSWITSLLKASAEICCPATFPRNSVHINVIEIVFFIAITLFLTFLVFINYRDSVPRENSKSIQVFKNTKEGFEGTTNTIGNTNPIITLPLIYTDQEYKFNLQIDGETIPFIADTGSWNIVYSDKHTKIKKINNDDRCYNKDNCGECMKDLFDINIKTTSDKCDKGLIKCKNSKANNTIILVKRNTPLFAKVSIILPPPTFLLFGKK